VWSHMTSDLTSALEVSHIMRYTNRITNLRWQTATNMKIVMSVYLNDKLADYDEICYSESDSDCYY